MTTIRLWTPARIKALRKRLNLTQDAFAIVVGVRSRQVIRWERMPTRIQHNTEVRLLELEAGLGSLKAQ